MPRSLVNFTPSRLSSCVAWWDVLSGITLNSSTVVSWQDRVGGYTFTQNTGSKQPTYAANIGSGKPVVAFNTATQKYMITNFSALSSVSGFTLVTVIGASGTVTNQLAMNADNNAPNLQINGNNLYGYSRAGEFGYYAFSDSTFGHIITQVFDGSLSGNANRFKMYDNGRQQTLTFTGTISSTTASGQTLLAIGDATSSPLVPYNGSVGDIAIFNTALSDNDRRTVERYMARKFKISIL